MDTIEEELDESILEWLRSDKPLPADKLGIKAVQALAKDHSCGTFTWGGKDRTIVDATTANMICSVYDKLNPLNQQKTDAWIKESAGRFTCLASKLWGLVK